MLVIGNNAIRGFSFLLHVDFWVTVAVPGLNSVRFIPSRSPVLHPGDNIFSSTCNMVSTLGR